MLLHVTVSVTPSVGESDGQGGHQGNMQPQYRQFQPSGQPQKSPHSSYPRRGGPGPPAASPRKDMNYSSRPSVGPSALNAPNPAAIGQQHRGVQQAQIDEIQTRLAKLRSRKPTDKLLPDGIEDSIVDPDSVSRYRQLSELERRLDATLIRKKLDITIPGTHSPKYHSTLRIWISNTVDDQPWQMNGHNVEKFDFSPNLEPSYRVKIEGRLLGADNMVEADNAPDVNADDSQEASAPNANQGDGRANEHREPGLRFSHFFKALTVNLKDSIYHMDAEPIAEWKKADRTQPGTSVADFDEFTFKRNGDENMDVVLKLYPQNDPERYEYSPELTDIVGMREGTKEDALLRVWEYVKVLGLQEDEEKRNFRCDDLLRKLTKCDTGALPYLGDYIFPSQLRPLSPICLPYTIRFDEAFHQTSSPTVYDVQVILDYPIRSKISTLFGNRAYMSTLKDIAALDDQLMKLIQATAVSTCKHSFFTSLSQDPSNFVRNWLSSQRRDLELICGESYRGGGEDASGDEWRRGGKGSLWGTKNALESINVILSQPQLVQRR